MIQFTHAYKFLLIPSEIKLYKATVTGVPANGRRLTRKAHRSAVNAILYGQAVAKRFNQIFGRAPAPVKPNKPIKRKEKKV